MAGRNLPAPAVCAQLHSEYKKGQTPLKLARLFDLSPRTVKLVLADETLAGPTPGPTIVDEPVQHVEPVPYDCNIEPIQPAIRDPRHVNGRAEALGGHTINVATNPRGSDFQFTVNHRQPSAGFPDRSPTTPAPDRGWDIWTGRPF
jgi:hypothetical protein